MKNRGMFYQNIEQGYQNPGMFIPPNGYNMNSTYQAYGPNAIPQQEVSFQDKNDYEERITRLEKQVKVLDNRLQKLENASNEVQDNFYMI